MPEVPASSGKKGDPRGMANATHIPIRVRRKRRDSQGGMRFGCGRVGVWEDERGGEVGMCGKVGKDGEIGKDGWFGENGGMFSNTSSRPSSASGEIS